MTRSASLAAAFLLAGCSAVIPVPAKVQELEAKLLPAGQLFCKKVTTYGPVVVAVADLAGVPVIATGMTKVFVDQACAALSAIPTPPPANLSVSVQVVPAAVPAAQ